MFADVRELFQMLDNSGPTARTAPAPYPIVDCEKMSAQGLDRCLCPRRERVQVSDALRDVFGVYQP